MHTVVFSCHTSRVLNTTLHISSQAARLSSHHSPQLQHHTHVYRQSSLVTHNYWHKLRMRARVDAPSHQHTTELNIHHTGLNLPKLVLHTLALPRSPCRQPSVRVPLRRATTSPSRSVLRAQLTPIESDETAKRVNKSTSALCVKFSCTFQCPLSCHRAVHIDAPVLASVGGFASHASEQR